VGLTHWSARDRERLSGRRAGARLPLSRGEVVLAAVSLFAAAAIAIGYTARLRAFDADERGRGAAAPLLLAADAEVAAIELALAPVFDRPADRRFAAARLAAALDAGLTPPNVGALATLMAPAPEVDRSGRLEVFAQRLAAARAAAADPAAVTGVPLFTAGDLAALKPQVTVRMAETHAAAVWWSAVLAILPFQIVSIVWRLRGRPGDRVLLAAAHLLTTLGFLVMLTRPDPLRDSLLVVRYGEGLAIALAACLAASCLNLRAASFLQLSYLPLAAALGLCVTLLVFGSGPGTSGARINLGPVQPGEAIRLLLCLFLAGYFARRWELVREVRGTDLRGRTLPAWLDLPRADLVLPVAAGVALALLMFVLQRDLGPALLVATLFLALFAVARGGAWLAAGGLAALAAGFWIGHALGISHTLSARLAMWRAPWDNAVRGGDQVAQASWALATGGADGAGLGLGATRVLPAGHTDLVLASIGEELGLAGVLAALALLGVIVWRGIGIARRASDDHGFFLALGLTLSLALPALVMTAGTLGLVPLTGLVTPFLSYGGSAMTVNFAALGLLAAIASTQAPARVAPPAVADPFGRPIRRLVTAMAAAAIAMVGVLVRVQVVSADEILVRPQLSRQADGGLRYQYNPRVLEAARRLPRGTILDRTGLPLATDEPGVRREATAKYAALGVPLDAACAEPSARCYPLGGAAFHVLGDARTRANWAASNSSYVERDAEDELRGFDDRAIVVRTSDDDEAPAGSTAAVRRDYGELVPLVRHRWEPDHEAVRALTDRPRTLQTTIDAALQHEAAAIVARAARRAGVDHAAAVVLDAATGEVLASVSYPFPSSGLDAPTPPSEALFDRARYGLYPPGSTFKLVTAAAALRQDPSWRTLPLACTRLPGQRAGVRIPGYGPPIRDDVRDRQPHGPIAMHDGLVKSCNAYFAQLAVRVGVEALASTAEAAGVPISPTAAGARSRDELPHAGYGQGQVVATPLRMARIVAAIASDGVIRQPPIVRGAGPAPETRWLTAPAARQLAGDMRDAVTLGTGRLLRDHPSRIAGKTGTAQVADAASHAWFVGYAPAGAATKRIAFAVLLEHAGYGGASAAAVAGQIVTAAADRGYVK
jgi:cell division protein FtsW (lipid II flippase)